LWANRASSGIRELRSGIWLADGLRQEEAMRGEGQKRKDKKEISARQKIKEERQKGVDRCQISSPRYEC